MDTIHFLKSTGNKVKEAGKGVKKLVGATGLAVALSMSPAMANDTSPTFTTFDGQMMTFEELSAIMYVNWKIWEYTERWWNILDNMTDEEYAKYSKWQDNIIAQENEKQEELKLQKQKNLAIIDAAKEREANAKEREALYSDLTIMADIILWRNGGDITNEEISKSFQRIAKDSTINLSSKDRTVYEFLSREYAQWRNITYVNKEIKTAIWNYAKELKPKIKNMSFSEEERQKLYIFIKKIEILIKQ